MRWSSCPRPPFADVLADAEAAGVNSATVYAAAMGDGDDPESKKRGAWLQDFLGEQQDARRRTELHGRVQLSRAAVRLSQYRARPAFAPARSARLSSPAARCSSGCAPAPTAACASPTASRRATRPTSTSPTTSISGRRPAHPADRAVHRRHPPAGGVHAGGRTRARSRQADHRDQDRRHAEIAGGRAVAHRRDRRRLRRLSRDVRALRHRQLPLARRHDRRRALAFDGGRLPKGPRIGFVTTSGGTVDLLYDYAEAEGAVDAGLHRRRPKRR